MHTCVRMHTRAYMRWHALQVPSVWGAHEEVRIAVSEKASSDDLLRAAIAAFLLVLSLMEKET